MPPPSTPPTASSFRRFLFAALCILVYVLLDRTTVCLQIWPDSSAAAFAAASAVAKSSPPLPMASSFRASFRIPPTPRPTPKPPAPKSGRGFFPSASARRAFVAGVGTGGTVMGAGKFLRERDSSIRVDPVEPAESPTLTTGCKVGNHRIQGISDEFILAIVRLQELDEVLSVADGDAILMAQKLAFSLGLAVAISSGCNFLAAVQAQEKLGSDATVITVFCDDSKKYLSTALMNEETPSAGYLTPQVELLGLGTVGRACEFCH